MNIKDIKPGQTVYILCREREPQVVERTVKCVGRKYVSLVGNWQEQFYLRNEADNYFVEKINMGYSRYLFATKDAVDLYIKRQVLESKIRCNISSVLSKMSMDQICQIADWVDDIRK